MSKPNNLFEFISNEHNNLKLNFEKLLLFCKKNRDWSRLIQYCEKHFEENHHRKEEEFVFSAIQNIPQIRAGGPLCTYFFELHRNNPPLSRAINEVKRITGMELTPKWTEPMTRFQKDNLPLVIPCEDHEAGRILLRAINKLITESPQDFEKVEHLFELYFEIQTKHFEKEETCFVPMCQGLMAPEQWSQIIIGMREKYSDICVLD